MIMTDLVQKLEQLDRVGSLSTISSHHLDWDTRGAKLAKTTIQPATAYY